MSMGIEIAELQRDIIFSLFDPKGLQVVGPEEGTHSGIFFWNQL